MSTIEVKNKHFTIERDISRPSFSTSMSGAGMVRYSPTAGLLEVSDGYTWIPMLGDTTYIGLSETATKAIDWAYKKMCEEEHINGLAEKYPAIKDAKEKLDILLALVNEREFKE